MNSKEEEEGGVQEESFSSDEDFSDNDDDESSTDVEAKLEEDDVFDVEFFKCYSALKKKDEKIYDEKVRFFTERDDSNSEDEKDPQDGGAHGIATTTRRDKQPTNAPKMTLLDHQLSLNPDEVEEPELSGPVKVDLNKPVSKSFYDRELEEIKKSIEKVSENIESDSDDELLVAKDGDGPRQKPKQAISKLLDKLEGEDDEDITHLKQVWSDPDNLTKEERYLRDYILNKRYLPSQADGTDDEKEGFFSKNLEELSDNEIDKPTTSRSHKTTHHSEEKDFDKIVRIPRNSTKTIRDLVEKREKTEKRLKKAEKEKKKKKLVKDADFEDLVGDMPTKFHYRETEAVDYGLSAEELLMATDEELDKWISLKDTVAYKSRDEELALKRKYDAKRNDLELKKTIFKSIYGDPDEIANEEPQVVNSKTKKKKKRKRNTDSESSIKESAGDKLQTESKSNQKQTRPQEESNRKKRNRKRGVNHKKIAKSGVAPDRLLAYGLSKTRLKKSKLL